MEINKGLKSWEGKLGLILIIIGIIMVIAAIIVYFTTSNPKPYSLWYYWVLLVGGIIATFVGIIFMIVAYTKKDNMESDESKLLKQGEEKNKQQNSKNKTKGFFE